MFWEDQIFLIHSNDFLLLPWASLGLSLGIQTRITISSQYSDWYLTSNITHIHYSRHALNHCNIPHNYETQTSWTVVQTCERRVLPQCTNRAIQLTRHASFLIGCAGEWIPLAWKRRSSRSILSSMIIRKKTLHVIIVYIGWSTAFQEAFVILGLWKVKRQSPLPVFFTMPVPTISQLQALSTALNYKPLCSEAIFR